MNKECLISQNFGKTMSIDTYSTQILNCVNSATK